MVSRFTSYPLFRLAAALVAGIFFADKFLSGSGMWPYAVAVCAFVCCACLYFSGRYRFRFLFGACACLLFAFVGATLLLQARQAVQYDWPASDAFYMGRLQTVPQKHKSTYLVTLRVEGLKKSSGATSWQSVRRDVLLYYVPDSTCPPLRCGDKVCFYGRVGLPPSDAAVTGFDYGRYLECQGISGTAVAFSGRWKRLSGSDGFSLRRQAMAFREKVLAVYRSWGLDNDVLAVVSALTVGDKSELTHELKATYSAAGASHVLALSGLHVGILAFLLSAVLFPLRWFRGGKWLAGICVVILLWGFAFLTGLSPSVVRAVVMFSFYMGASVCTGGRLPGGYALVLAAFAMLLYQPLYLFDVGFQLSFSAVFGILLFVPCLERLWHPRRILFSYVWKALSVSTAAQLGTAPLVLYYFGAFPTYFLLSNLFVTPLAVLILAFSVAALCFSGVPALSVWVVSALSFSVKALNALMGWVCGLFGSQITSVYYEGWQSLLLAVSLLALAGYVYGRSARPLQVALVSANVLVLSFVYGHLFPPASSLCFVRQGVYAKCGRRLVPLSSGSGLFRVGSHAVACLDNDDWKDKQSAFRLPMDYVYVCRGFHGGLDDIRRLFGARCILIDASLGDFHRKRLIRECEEVRQAYVDLSGKGFHAILL